MTSLPTPEQPQDGGCVTPGTPQIVLDLWAYDVPNSGVDDRTIPGRAADTITELLAALENFCLAAEYWAGCDEGCDADTASSEIMRSGGAWPAEAYDKARAALSRARGEQP